MKQKDAGNFASTEELRISGLDTIARRWFPRKLVPLLRNFVLYIVLIVICLVLLFPNIWMISTSLKEQNLVFEFPPKLIPNPVRWQNYTDAMNAFPFWLYFRNSLIVTVVATFGTVLSSSLVAFGFARLRFPEREFLFTILLSTMMLPFIVTMIPTYVIFTKINWVNTFLPLTVPSFFGSAPFYIFLLRQFYRTIPYDYDEAAYLDGASRLRVWWSVLLPFTKAPLAVITVFSILGNWNDFLGPLLYMNDPKMRTLAVGLAYFYNQFTVHYPQLMAASTLMLIPVIILFFFTQRYFIQGILLTGLSGR